MVRDRSSNGLVLWLTLSPHIALLDQVRKVKNNFRIFVHVGDSRITLKNLIWGSQVETSS